MIIQTGQRTDIPAFYSEWFMNRIREGFVCVRNPYDRTAVSRYILSPDVVDVIGFCSKNPSPMLPHLSELKSLGYDQYWFVTITPYGKDIEPNVPHFEEVIESFKALSDFLGVDSVGWRYDPIFLSDKYTLEYHLDVFEKMARALNGYTKTCVISFIDMFEKVKRNFPEVRPVCYEDRLRLGKAMVQIVNTNGMVLKPCAEGNELAIFGADCSGCMTIETFERAINCRLKVPASAITRSQNRKECACYISGDIGQYDTCLHLCRYCYANNDVSAVKENRLQHDPNSPLLIGQLEPTDVVRQVEQKSWKDKQISLFDLV